MGLILLQTTPLQGPLLLYMGWKEDRCCDGLPSALDQVVRPELPRPREEGRSGATRRRGVDVLRRLSTPLQIHIILKEFMSF